MQPALQDLAQTLARTRTSTERRALCLALLTPAERARLALRWELVCRLAAGEQQRRIAQDLGISLCKITRGARELKREPIFRRIVDQALARRQRLSKASLTTPRNKESTCRNP